MIEKVKSFLRSLLEGKTSKSETYPSVEEYRVLRQQRIDMNNLEHQKDINYAVIQARLALIKEMRAGENIYRLLHLNDRTGNVFSIFDKPIQKEVADLLVAELKELGYDAEVVDWNEFCWAIRIKA